MENERFPEAGHKHISCGCCNGPDETRGVCWNHRDEPNGVPAKLCTCAPLLYAIYLPRFGEWAGVGWSRVIETRWALKFDSIAKARAHLLEQGYFEDASDTRSTHSNNAFVAALLANGSGKRVK